MKTFILTLFLISLDVLAADLSYKTLREEGHLYFDDNHLTYQTHQKNEKIKIKPCNQNVIKSFKNSLLMLLAKIDQRNLSNRSGSVFFAGQVIYLPSNSRAYKVFDNIHDQLDKLKQKAKMNCLHKSSHK